MLRLDPGPLLKHNLEITSKTRENVEIAGEICYHR